MAQPYKQIFRPQLRRQCNIGWPGHTPAYAKQGSRPDHKCVAGAVLGKNKKRLRVCDAKPLALPLGVAPQPLVTGNFPLVALCVAQHNRPRPRCNCSCRLPAALQKRPIGLSGRHARLGNGRGKTDILTLGGQRHGQPRRRYKGAGLILGLPVQRKQGAAQPLARHKA